MKNYHLFFALFLVFIFFIFGIIYLSNISSSAAGTQCNPERLNQISDIGLFSQWVAGNRTGGFVVPLEYPYAKFYNIINASLLGSCSTLNSNCNYYVNGVFC